MDQEAASCSETGTRISLEIGPVAREKPSLITTANPRQIDRYGHQLETTLVATCARSCELDQQQIRFNHHSSRVISTLESTARIIQTDELNNDYTDVAMGS